MKLSVIIPSFNEEKTLFQIVEKVLNVNLEKEIIIVNDASTDKTDKVLEEIKIKFPETKILTHEKNMGKGAAIKTGLNIVSGNIVIIQDADLELDPNDYLELVKPIENGISNVVFGSRELGKKNRHLYFTFYIGGKIVSMFANFLYGSNLTDTSVGYKIFKTETLKSLNLKCNGFDFDTEVTAKILKLGNKVIEVPVNYYPRKKEDGKKIKWTDGFIALWSLLKFRFID